jgi:nitrogen regulatory protein P-II 2
MKKVEMTIAPFKIKVVRDALARIGFNQMTVSKIRKLGGQAGCTGYCRGGKYESKYEPVFFSKTKIEIELADEDLEKVLGAIEDCAEGASNRDEKVFVYSLDDTVKPGKKIGSVAAI